MTGTEYRTPQQPWLSGHPAAPLPPPVPSPPPPQYGTPPPQCGTPPPQYGTPPPYWVPPLTPKRSKGWLVALTVAGSLIAVVALFAATVALFTDDPSASESRPTMPPVLTEPVLTEPAGNDEVVPPTDPVVVEPLLQGPVDVLSSFAFSEQMAVRWTGGEMTMDVSGVFVAPTDTTCVISMSMDGNDFRFVITVVGEKAWVDYGMGLGPELSSVNDPDIAPMIASCPSSHELWGDDFDVAPSGGVPATIDGLAMTLYDVTESPAEWQTMFGLPVGLSTESMTVWTSADGAWVGGVDATVTGDASTFRNFTGMPPEGVTGTCTMTLVLHITRPDDPTITVVAPE